MDGKKLMSSVLTFSQVPQHLTSFADVKTPLDLYTATMFVVVMVMKGSWITFVKGWKDNELSRYCVIYYDDPHSNSAVRTRVITNYVFSHASVHITKRALTINVVPLFLKLHRPILYGNIIKRPFNPLLTYD